MKGLIEQIKKDGFITVYENQYANGYARSFYATKEGAINASNTDYSIRAVEVEIYPDADWNEDWCVSWGGFIHHQGGGWWMRSLFEEAWG
jgi:hypothetical protein